MATGSDDGYIGLWDRRVKSGADGANVAHLRPMHTLSGDGKTAHPPGRRGAGGVADNGGDCVTRLEVRRNLTVAFDLCCSTQTPLVSVFFCLRIAFFVFVL